MKVISVCILFIVLFHQPVSSQSIKPEKKIRLQFYAGGGLSLYQMKMGGSYNDMVGDVKFKPDLSNTISNGIDIHFRRFKNIIARFQVSFSEFIFKGTGKPPGRLMENYSYMLAGYNVTPNVSVLYQFSNSTRVQFYGGAGINFHSPRYTRSKTDYTMDFGSANLHLGDYIPLPYYDPVFAPEVKAGVFYEKFELNVNASYGRILKEKSFSFNVANYTLNMFYHFK
jgi:hypothetical protein